MGNQLAEKERTTGIALIHTLQTQQNQGQALIQALEKVYEIEDKMTDFESKLDEARALVNDATKQITINYEEQKEVQSIVAKIAQDAAKEHEKKLDTKFSDNLFKAWKGRFINLVYKYIKRRMNVVRYTAVKRIDYHELKMYLDTLSYYVFTESELKPTPGILNVMKLEKGDE
ncbi:ORF6C domain-containing protein [Enterococcus cecorum]|uniref:hypothetical protein n=1 Tax=Enterococcus cecorum TaxID=44008 RepID=UPI000B083391|nr:hypothetical protein [Enterococcus cecorum]CAI3338397.1 ORF6C domain-containing protein [Enterococcus cecorum]